VFIVIVVLVFLLGTAAVFVPQRWVRVILWTISLPFLCAGILALIQGGIAEHFFSAADVDILQRSVLAHHWMRHRRGWQVRVAAIWRALRNVTSRRPLLAHLRPVRGGGGWPRWSSAEVGSQKSPVRCSMFDIRVAASTSVTTGWTSEVGGCGPNAQDHLARSSLSFALSHSPSGVFTPVLVTSR
jgi:hypothetical protein